MPGAQSPTKATKFKLHHLRAEEEHESLRITSMMDMMTIILVFLLKTFSTQGDLSATEATLVLPESDNETEAGFVDRLAVGQDQIFFNEDRVMSTMEAQGSDDLVIKPLQVVLEEAVEQQKNISSSIGEGEEELADRLKIMILLDENHLFSLVKSVVSTAAASGYLNISLAATQNLQKYSTGE